MSFKPRPQPFSLLRKALGGALLLSVLGYGNAWATVNIPEALSSGQQLGADAENQTAGNLAGMQTGVSTTTGATAGGTAATTGVSNTQAVGSPANGADAESGATASGSYNFTLNCNSNNQKNPISPGDYELFAANCTYNGSGASAAVSGLTLYYCTVGISGGDCAEGSPNWQATGIGPGQTVQIAQGVNVTLSSCPANDSGSCTGTVAVSNSTMHTSANLTNDATNMVVTGQSGADTMLANTYNSGNYQTAIQTANSTDQLNSCTQQIKGGLNGNGIIYTCNGQQQADFNSTNCKSTQQCVKWATQSESYTQSCNENIPLTENVCTTNTPTENCTITADTAQYTCDNTLQVTLANGSPTDTSLNYTAVFSGYSGAYSATGVPTVYPAGCLSRLGPPENSYQLNVYNSGTSSSIQVSWTESDIWGDHAVVGCRYVKECTGSGRHKSCSNVRTCSIEEWPNTNFSVSQSGTVTLAPNQCTAIGNTGGAFCDPVYGCSSSIYTDTTEMCYYAGAANYTNGTAGGYIQLSPYSYSYDCDYGNQGTVSAPELGFTMSAYTIQESWNNGCALYQSAT